MKIAILTDVHANFIALQTVAIHVENWQPDFVVVAGDTINRGPRPVECLHFIQEKIQTAGWQIIKGNHEDYIMSHAQMKYPLNELELHSLSYWTYQQLNGDMSHLKTMPAQISLIDPNGGEVRITHASMCGIRDGIYPETSDEELRQKIAPPPRVLCVGHTHRAHIRQLDSTLVVNAGSVGLPFDGDRRAGYAQLTWRHGQWQAQIIRLDYDMQTAEQDFYRNSYVNGAGPLVQVVLKEFHQAKGRLASWSILYEKHILAGEMTMAESVQYFLANLS